MSATVDHGQPTLNIASTFLVTGDTSGGTIAAFELTVKSGQRLPAPAHSHDHYEETIYGLDGVLTWTVNGQPIEVGKGQALCIPVARSTGSIISAARTRTRCA